MLLATGHEGSGSEASARARDFLAEEGSDFVFVLREEESDVSSVRPLLIAVGLGVFASCAWTSFGASVVSLAGVAIDSTTGLDFGEKNEVIDLNPGCAAKDVLLLDEVFALGFPISLANQSSGKLKEALATIRVSGQKKKTLLAHGPAGLHLPASCAYPHLKPNPDPRHEPLTAGAYPLGGLWSFMHGQNEPRPLVFII
jgi:hypothetical protein